MICIIANYSNWQVMKANSTSYATVLIFNLDNIKLVECVPIDRR